MIAPDLIKLAERVEQASGPDRELDAEIMAVTCTAPGSRVIWGKGYRLFLNPGKGRLPFHVSGGAGTKFGMIHQTRRLTASLDAAMTLVPEGSIWAVTNCGCEGKEPDFSIASAVVAMDPKGQTEPTEARSPALALTAAALKARAIVTQQGETK